MDSMKTWKPILPQLLPQNLGASQIEDIGTPSQKRKLELCDIIEDSSGFTSSSKSRKISFPNMLQLVNVAYFMK